MELKERKRINNRLPGYEAGKNGLLSDSTFVPNGHVEMDFGNGVRLGANPTDGKEPNFNSPLSSRSNADTKPSSAAGMGPWFALGEWAGSGIAAGINAIRRPDDILSDAGRTTAQTNGFSYEKQNLADQHQQMKDYDRELGMSFLTNPFKGLTMLFGRNKQKKQIAEANRIAGVRNQYNSTSAYSDYLAQQNALNGGDTSGLMLYGANRGKDVETSIGKVGSGANARVAKGETIADGLNNPSESTAHIVRNGKRGIDTELANLDSSTVVLGGDKIYGTNIKFQDAAMPYTQILETINKNERRPSNISSKLRGSLGKQTDELQSKTVSPLKEYATAELKKLADMQALQHQIEGYNKMYSAKRGKDKLPGFALGSNWWIDGLGMLTGLGQTIGAATQRIKKPYSYVGNPYSNAALQGLAGLSINPYPMMQQMRDQERRNLYAINRAGGLSGAQKAYANIATGIGTQRNIADLGANIQAQNNQYKTNYYSTLMNAGQADRQARMAANQFDLDYYSKAHAAKLQGLQMGIYNMLNSLQTGYANSFKRNQFNKMYNLYAADLDDEKRARLAQISKYGVLS